jgi:hypothetical protein
MKSPLCTILLSTLILGVGATASAKGPLLQKVGFEVKKQVLLGRVQLSPFASSVLKKEAAGIGAEMASLGRQASRVDLSTSPGNQTATYYRADGSLLGKVELTQPNAFEQSLALTMTAGKKTTTKEVFRTGRSALKLVSDEVRAASAGKTTWANAKRQILGELVNGTVTAGTRVSTVEDPGLLDKTTTTDRVEQWLARRPGAPNGASIQKAPAKALGRAVIGLYQSESSQNVVKNGKVVPNDDPEAEGRPQRMPLASQSLNYYVSPKGQPVFSAVAQGN